MKERQSKSGSVEKALSILDIFSMKTPSLTLDAIAERSGFPKPTVFRMLCSLEKFGYVKRVTAEGQMRFKLGMAFMEKSQIVTSDFDIREYSKSELLELRNTTGLSVQLAVRDGDHAVYIEQFESLNPIRVYPQVGRRVPLYAAACPRILLAYMSEEEQDYILGNYEYTSFTPETKISYDSIKNELKDVKAKGYSFSIGELYEGTTAIAVPIFGKIKEVLGAISIIGMSQDFGAEQMEKFISQLKETAKRIENNL
jgi:DNA-binding IclR family transcriptional regulator